MKRLMATNGIQDSYRGDKEESESAESGDLETLQKVEHITFRRKKKYMQNNKRKGYRTFTPYGVQIQNILVAT